MLSKIYQELLQKNSIIQNSFKIFSKTFLQKFLGYSLRLLQGSLQKIHTSGNSPRISFGNVFLNNLMDSCKISCSDSEITEEFIKKNLPKFKNYFNGFFRSFSGIPTEVFREIFLKIASQKLSSSEIAPRIPPRYILQGFRNLFSDYLTESLFR